MPAKTVKQLENSLKKYLDYADQASPSTPFKDALNEIMPRIYKMGFWREMLVEHKETAGDGYVSLPNSSEAILAGILDHSPMELYSMWHDYRLFGTTSADDTYLLGFVDDGIAPTFRDLGTASTDKYKIQLVALKPSASGHLPATGGGTVTIRFERSSDTEAGEHNEETMTLNSASKTSRDFAQTDVTSVTSIIFNDIPDNYPIRVKAIHQAGGTDLLLADITTSSGVCRYRRFRVGGTNTDSIVHMLVKRRYEEVDGDNDIVHVPEMSILKHALLGKLSEDNADVQRAEYHWAICLKLLEEDLDSHRGAVKPRINFDPTGKAGYRIPNMF